MCDANEAKSTKWRGSWTVKASLRSQYLIRCKNYQQEDDTWEPRTNLHPVAIKLEKTLYNHSLPFRYPMCDLSCNSECSVNVHAAKTRGKKNDVTVQNEKVYKGSLTDSEMRASEIEDQQGQLPTI